MGTFIRSDVHDFNPRSHEESGFALRICAAEILHFNPRSHEESGLSVSAFPFRTY